MTYYGNASKLKNIQLTVSFKNNQETLGNRFSGDDHVSDIAQVIMDQVTGNMFGIKSMQLHYRGKILKMDQLLSSLEGIRGDAEFNSPILVASDEIEESKGQTGNNDLLYYSIGDGLNYKGKCMNEKCRAYKQSVLMQRGFGEKIDPFDEICAKKIQCPGCKKEFKLEECFLYKCDCKIMYQKKGCDEKTALYGPRDGDYVILRAGDKNKADYQYLTFNVCALDGCVLL